MVYCCLTSQRVRRIDGLAAWYGNNGLRPYSSTYQNGHILWMSGCIPSSAHALQTLGLSSLRHTSGLRLDVLVQLTPLIAINYTELYS